jgi:hypothetical protein
MRKAIGFKVLLFMFVLAIFIPLQACQEDAFEKNVYSTISSVATAYDEILTLAAEKKVKGEITEEQWNSISAKAIKLSAAGASLSIIMADYKRALENNEEADPARARVTAAMFTVVENYRDIVSLMETVGYKDAEIPKIKIPEEEK